jgi:CubicO group peptidase (beta-lactamase class C family)
MRQSTIYTSGYGMNRARYNGSMARVLLILSATICFLGRADLGSEIDTLMSAYDKPGSPGAAVLAMRAGMMTYRKGYGLAEVETGRFANENTNYRMASVSKQFTAMAAMILVEQGKLGLEETLKDIFPDFPSYGSKVTINHLLHHTSGLVDYESSVTGSKQVSDADVLAILKRQSSTSFPPGSRYSYSNSGYCLLAQVVETRSGMQYEDFVLENVFKRLGMHESHVYEKDNIPNIRERAYGYTPSGGSFSKTDQSNTSATQGDGGVYTSTVDYEKWILGLESLLSPPFLSQYLTPGRLNDGSATSYAMGWSVGTHHGFARYSHTGSTIGFRTAVEWIPSLGAGVAVFINRASSSPWDISRQILELVVKPPR